MLFKIDLLKILQYSELNRRNSFFIEHLRWLIFLKKHDFLKVTKQPVRNLVMNTNNFFFSTRFRNILWCIKGGTGLFISLLSLSGFLNNSVRVYPIELKIVMLYHMNKTFRNSVFSVSINVSLNRILNIIEFWVDTCAGRITIKSDISALQKWIKTLKH